MNQTTGSINLKNLCAKANLANVLLWGAYAALVCFTAAHHELWCDEADSWLSARDQSLSVILSRTGYMGTPALWYFTLFPFAKAGLPYFAMTALNVFFALVSAGLIIFRSPFSFWLRAVICFSYLFVYEYAVIARSYGTSVLLIISLAALYKRRQELPLLYGLLIALLANTNVHGLLVSMALTAAFVLTNWRQKLIVLAPILIASAGIGFSILQLLPPADGQFPSTFASQWWKQPVLSLFKGAFFPDPATSINHGFSPPLLTGPIALTLKVISFAIIFLIAKRLWTNRFALLTFLFSYVGLFGLFTFKYYGSVRHWGFFVLVAIFCLWIQLEEKEQAVRTSRIDLALSGLLALSFAYSSAVGFYACITDINRPFSSSAEGARQLKIFNRADDPVICYPNSLLSVLPYLPGLRFFYPPLNEFGTHAMWNRAEKQVLTMTQVGELVDSRFGRQRKLFFLSDKESPELVQQGFRLLYKNVEAPITSNETIVLYGRN